MSEEGVERRLTTILAADVVGYSRLMAADEAGTLTSLKALRRELIEPKTAEYHGRVVKLMGDGTLMEFGSVVDAVNFAADVQRAMALRNTDVPEDQRITYRMGINIGDIIVEGDDIYGDGVNVAARLETLAKPGGICIAQMPSERPLRRFVSSVLCHAREELPDNRHVRFSLLQERRMRGIWDHFHFGIGRKAGEILVSRWCRFIELSAGVQRGHLNPAQPAAPIVVLQRPRGVEFGVAPQPGALRRARRALLPGRRLRDPARSRRRKSAPADQRAELTTSRTRARTSTG